MKYILIILLFSCSFVNGQTTRKHLWVETYRDVVDTVRLDIGISGSPLIFIVQKPQERFYVCVLCKKLKKQLIIYYGGYGMPDGFFVPDSVRIANSYPNQNPLKMRDQ